MNKVYITSANTIIGTGWDADQNCHKILPQQYEPLLQSIPTRNMDRISKIALAAAHSTLETRGITVSKDAPNNYGILFGTQFSALDSIHCFDMEALGKGALAVNPGLFPNTVLNAPACQTSIHCRFAGPVYTVCSGPLSTLDALGIGYNFIRSGITSMVLAGGADEAEPLHCAMQNNRKEKGEAAGFLLLESANAIHYGAPLAEIVGYTSCALHQKQRADLLFALADMITAAVKSGGVSARDIACLSLYAWLPVNESERLLADLYTELKLNGTRETIKTDWMGAGGIVQANKMIGSRHKALWCLVNADEEKAAVLIIKRL